MIHAVIIISVSLLLIGAIAVLILIQSGDLLVFVFATPAVALVITFLTSLYFRNKNVLASKIQRVCKAIFIIAEVNIISFFIILFMLGGSAPNGKMEDGRYFLGDHGYYKEVPPVVYFYSFVHTYSVFITGLLSIPAGLVYGMTGGNRQLRIKPQILKLLPRKKV